VKNDLSLECVLLVVIALLLFGAQIVVISKLERLQAAVAELRISTLEGKYRQ
jgi:hypothetical protein